MSGYEVPELGRIEDAIDALDSPTSTDVFQATRPYDERAIASVAAQRATNGGGGSQPAAPQLVGARGTQATTSDLYLLDAIPKRIGSIGYALTGLAYDPITGTLFGATSGNSAASPRSLISIDPATGAGTLIGAIGQSVSDIACSADGHLYGAKVGSTLYQRLVSINKATGAGSVVGSAPAQALTGGALSFHPDGTLCLLAGDNGAGAQIKLYVVNPSTGAVTAPFGLSGISPDDLPIVQVDLSAWTNPIAAMAFSGDGTLWIAAMSFPGDPVHLWFTEILQDEDTAASAVDTGITLGRDQVNGLDAIAWVAAAAFA